MDLTGEIERAYQEMQWTDFAATIEATIQEVLGETDNQIPEQPPPPRPPHLPAGPEANNLPPIHIEGYGWCTLVAATPNDPNSQVSIAPQSGHQEDGNVRLSSFSGVPSTSRQPVSP